MRLCNWQGFEISSLHLFPWEQLFQYKVFNNSHASMGIKIYSNELGGSKSQVDSLFLYQIEAETKWPPFVWRHFKCIFLNENVWGLVEIPLKYVPECRIDNKQALVQIMAWCRPGDKPLSKPMMVILLTHICVTRPQWVKELPIFLQTFCWPTY